MVDRILFVADQLADAPRSPAHGHPGGAELTDEAARAACPFRLTVRRFAELELAELDRHDVIVVGNADRAIPRQLEAIASTRRHVSFEHDVRICRWRGNFPASRDAVHAIAHECWCPHLALRELYRTARGVIFLTHRQEREFSKNRFFETTRRRVLGSSLFSTATLDHLERLGTRAGERNAALYLAAPDRIKGTALARRYCETRGLAGSAIRGHSPEEALERMARGRTFVYLPLGLEPAGRMPVEARLAGCEVVVNENVGVAGEPWWQLDRAGALAHLEAAPLRFWRLVEELASGRASEIPKRRVSPWERAGEATLRVSMAAGRLLPRWPTAPSVLRRALQTERYAPW